LKKLLYITNAIDGSGGLERVLSVKTKVLTEDFGYEIHIITLSKSEPLEDQSLKKDSIMLLTLCGTYILIRKLKMKNTGKSPALPFISTV